MMIRLISIFVIAALCFPGICGAVGRQTPEPTVDSAYSVPDAQSAALDHAGVAPEQATDTRTEFDMDDGRAEYEVEFRDGDWEYEYTVDAETGAIVEWDKDYDPPAASASTPEPAPEVSAAEELTAEEAKAVALAHAGVAEADVTRLRAEFDVDDGVAEYEVEFRYGDWEYDYTIDAATGKVLSWDKDYDPPEKSEKPAEAVSVPEPEKATERLTAEQAKAIALAHAGVAETDVTRLRAEFDVDDGVAEYEVEFNIGIWEYEYEINADTGAILSWERDDD